MAHAFNTRHQNNRLQSRRLPRLTVKVFISLMLIAGCVWLWQKMQDPQYFPIRHVRVWATYAHISPEQIKQQVTAQSSRGFFGVSLGAIEQQLAYNLPWINTVIISRVWPDSLEIKITEKEAVARWIDSRLFSAQGVLFEPGDLSKDSTLTPLPQLQGTPQQAALLFNLYQHVHGLLATQQLSLKKLSLGAFGELTLLTDHGTTLHLGNDRTIALAHLNRFLHAYPNLIKNNSSKTLKYVDLRYPNGFSVLFN